MKISFMFPGQGAQYVGMGKEFHDKYEESRNIFYQANDILGFDVAELSFNGPEEKLNTTRYSQPAILCATIAVLTVINKIFPSIQPNSVAGLSLGEYSALVCANSLSFQDALELVDKRALYMDEASKKIKGGMLSVIGLDENSIKSVIQENSFQIDIANYNCPGQIVVSGPIDIMEKSISKFNESGAKKAVKLKVSGAFHSRYMKEAGDKLKQVIESKNISSPEKVFIPNTVGVPETDSEKIREFLVNQVSESVYWQKSIECLIDSGTEIFIEIGPGKVLGGLLKRINRRKQYINVQSIDDLSRLEELQ